MPINYEDEFKKKQQEVDDLLLKRSGDIKSVEPVENTSVLNRLQGVPGLDRGALNASSVQQMPEFMRKAGERTDTARLSRSNALQELIYNNAVQKATQAGLKLKDANEFARRVLEQRQQQQFDAEQSQLDRDLSLRKEKIQDIYADKGIALQQQYADGGDSQAALLRALLGVGVGIGTSTYLQNLNKQKNVNVPNIVSNNSSLRMGSGFAPRKYT